MKVRTFPARISEHSKTSRFLSAVFPLPRYANNQQEIVRILPPQFKSIFIIINHFTTIVKYFSESVDSFYNHFAAFHHYAALTLSVVGVKIAIGICNNIAVRLSVNGYNIVCALYIFYVLAAVKHNYRNIRVY